MLKRIDKTGPRADLAKAIEAARDADAHCAALRASVTRIEDERFEARHKLDAETARETDGSNGNDEVIRRLLAGETSIALLEPAADHKTQAEAERAIEACNRALALLRTELADAERALELRTRRVRDAAGAVIAAEALDAMLAESERLRGELAAREAVLSFIHPHLPRDQAAKVEKALVSSDFRGEHPSVDSWRQAIEALSRDASAELPISLGIAP
jgi:hypothetical protein